ncbi:ester cyclase [Paenibacillus pasadenensis]|uniref:ester cyclase n=1 Tax=Paenibacillus pasadenensis TaxID=217090 RepID=UPI00203DED38|nr:ester cyclase [Paenibacillus pasadenensis]MCM3746770.1 ester cyclase [Paenibacillus pasadenensis]
MSTTVQTNLDTVRAFIERFWNEGDLDCADQFLAEDYTELSYQSKEGLKQFAAKLLEAFPDKLYTVEHIIGEGDIVLVRMNVKGKHGGMFFGRAATGNEIDVTLYRRYRVADGKITEHRGWIDMATMWHQLNKTD